MSSLSLTCTLQMHYMLPKYQLTLFATTRQRYTCETCVTIPDYIVNAKTYKDENSTDNTQELQK